MRRCYELLVPLIASIAFLSTSAPARAQTPPDSPGSIALLVEHPTDAAAQQRVKAALADPHPETRTVAARLVFDTAMRGLLPDVEAALAREQDPVAGSEELRAWMTLAPSAATYTACVDAAVRLGYPATEVAVDTFARLNARDLLTYLPRLVSQVDGDRVVNAIMVVTAANHNARLQYVLKFAESPSLLDPLLFALHQDGDHPAQEFLLTLLKSPNADVRQVAIFYLQTCQATDKTAMTADVKAALDPLIEASATQVTWEALGLELLSRAEGRKPRERRWLDLAKSRRPPGTRHTGDESMLLALTNTELADLFQVTMDNRDEGREFRTRTEAHLKNPTKAAAKPDQPAWLTPNVGVRTVPPFAPALWTDLMRLTGCKPAQGFFIAADVAYRPDGRPARIRPGETTISQECQRAAAVLFSLTVAEEARPRPADFSDVQVLRLDTPAITCADRAVPFIVEHTRRRMASQGAMGMLVRPKSINEFPPPYTAEARRRRLEGLVTVAGMLTPDGCFSQGSVQTSPSPLLAGPALYSVLGWQFKPGTIDGNPVPVSMGVIVPFKLSH